MSDATEHIAGWEAAGLIDRETADRLRAASDPTAVRDTTAPDTTSHPRSAAAALFGPSVTISEVFAYLGGAFLLAAWSSFMSRTSGPNGEPGVVLGAMALLAAGVLGVHRPPPHGWRGARIARVGRRLPPGLDLRGGGGSSLRERGRTRLAGPRRGRRRRRAWPPRSPLRVLHPAVLTQVGVLAWLTGLGVSTLSWLQVTLFPENFSPDTGLPTSTGPDPLLLVVATAAWWLATAVGIALIGLREARIADRDADAGAGRRAAISRFWAGIVAVLGLSQAISRSAGFANGEYGRVVEPWIGDLALVVLSAILVERAFRRDATSFIYAAALGLMIALTDFNLTYLSGSTEVALLIEGLILLAVGVVADRLRRRIGRGDAPKARGAGRGCGAARRRNERGDERRASLISRTPPNRCALGALGAVPTPYSRQIEAWREGTRASARAWTCAETWPPARSSPVDGRLALRGMAFWRSPRARKKRPRAV